MDGSEDDNYVRVRRLTLTVFVTVELDCPAVELKRKLETLLKKPVADQRLLVSPERGDKELDAKEGASQTAMDIDLAALTRLDDEGSLEAQGVKCSDVVFLVLRRQDGSWEDVQK